MKYLLPLSVISIFMAIILTIIFSADKAQIMTVVREGNLEKRPLEMALNQFQDSECGMIIDDLSFASQVIGPDGKTWFFHDHGSMVAWLKTKSFREEAVIWVHDLENGDWIDGRQAWYSRTDPTPMLYGFGAYTTKKAELISFDEMQAAMLRGETFANPAYRKQLMDP